MKKIMLLGPALLFVLILFTGSAFCNNGELKIFTWSEYMDEENMPKDFEKATGIKVKLDMYESNEEMMAKLQAGGLGQYDIIIPTDFIITSLINLKLIVPLDHSKIPNLKKTVLTVFIFSVMFTGVLTFLASMKMTSRSVALRRV